MSVGTKFKQNFKLTLFVEDAGGDERYKQAQRNDTQQEQEPPLSLCPVWPTCGTTAVQKSHLHTHTHTHSKTFKVLHLMHKVKYETVEDV